MKVKVNNFDVLKRMSAENKDIRLSTTIIGMKAVKAGTQVEMGVEGNIIAGWMTEKLQCCLLVFDLKQFNEILAVMEAEVK